MLTKGYGYFAAHLTMASSSDLDRCAVFYVEVPNKTQSTLSKH
jgi:hypothetical protein